MKAIRVQEFGGPEMLRLQNVPDLMPGDGEVLVRVAAAGINPVETYIRSGQYGRLPALPYTPGTDGAGVVERIGAGVSHVRPGQRVYLAGSLTGTYAQQCLATADQVHPLADALSFAQGAAIGVPYATAHRALFGRGRARRGESVLVHGATGGVGIAVVQLAAFAGLRVFATGGTDSGRVLLAQQWAALVFDHHAAGYLERIREMTQGRGVDLIVEMLANVNLAQDLSVLASGGRVVVVGSRGRIEIDPRDLMVREADVRGVMLSAATPDELAAIHRDLASSFESGAAVPVVGCEFRLADAAEAHAAVLAPGAHGKIVLLPGES